AEGGQIAAAVVNRDGSRGGHRPARCPAEFIVRRSDARSRPRRSPLIPATGRGLPADRHWARRGGGPDNSGRSRPDDEPQIDPLSPQPPKKTNPKNPPPPVDPGGEPARDGDEREPGAGQGRAGSALIRSTACPPIRAADISAKIRDAMK